MLQRTIDRLLAEQQNAYAAPAVPPGYSITGDHAHVRAASATTTATATQAQEGAGPAVGTGKGRRTMPGLEQTLGIDVRTVPHVGFTKASKYLDGEAMRFNRHIAYDEDIDAEHIEPSAARKAYLETRDLAGTTFYEDPRAETFYRNMHLDANENEQVRKIMTSALMKDNIDRRRAGMSSRAVEERAKRRDNAAVGTEEARAAFAAQPITIAQKLFDLSRPTREESDRDKFLPPPKMDEKERMNVREPSLLDIADLKSMLDREPFPGMSKEFARQFRGINEISTIRRALEPEMTVTEKRRSHYNCMEVVETMLKCGAKLAAWSRIQSPARLSDVLDPDFYASNLEYDHETARTKFTGGHEHYDEYNHTTHLIALHFGCCRKAFKKEDKTPIDKVRDTSTLDSAAAADKGALSEFIHPDDDYWDDTDFDQDDDYTGGNDLQDVLTQFDHIASVYLVEATDSCHENEVLTRGLCPPTTSHTREELDDNAMQSDFVDENNAPAKTAQAAATATQEDMVNAYQVEALKKAMPDGLGTTLDFEEARRYVGRYKAAQFAYFLTHPRPMFPLCLRGYKFTHAKAR